MQKSLAQHMDDNAEALRVALDEAEKRPNLAGQKLRRAWTKFDKFTSSKAPTLTLVHVRHFKEHGFFQIKVRDISTEVDTAEEVVEWVRRQFDTVAQDWKPEF